MNKIGVFVIVALMIFSLVQFGVARESESEDDRRVQPVIKVIEDSEFRERIGEEVRMRLRQENITEDNVRERVKQEIRIRMRDGNLTREEIKEEVERFRERVRDGNGTIEVEGRNVNLRAIDDEKIEMIVGRINAKTGLNLTTDDMGNGTIGSILRAYLSNGRYAEVKVMPNTASQRALERLQAKCEDRNCTVELKEVRRNGDDLNESDDDSNETRMVYEVKTEKRAKILWLFKKSMNVEAQVDAETGEVIKAHKPWWSIIANEEDATEEEIEEDVSGNESIVN